MSDDQGQHLDLGPRLRTLMEDHEQSVASMADIAGVSKSALEKYLAGPSSPRAVTVAALCSHFGVSADWLMYGTASPVTEEDVGALRDLAWPRIWSLMRDLRSGTKTAEYFLTAEPGTEEWNNFARDIAFSTATYLALEYAERRHGYARPMRHYYLPANR